MVKNRKWSNYRAIWIQHFGDIPKDENGYSYEIHHKDGNYANNDINNLQCVSIQEHFNIHFDRGDIGACALIATKLENPPILEKQKLYGSKNGFYGKKHTPESNEKNRLSHLGKKQSKETIEKKSKALKGRPAWNKGIPVPDHVKEKQSRNACKSKAKFWKIIGNNIEVITNDRKGFCKQYNLNYNTLNDYSRKGKPYKGFLCIECTINEVAANNSKCR